MAEQQVIGSYRVVKKLGAGGMGAVYEAEHALMGRRAAIKVLLPEMSRNEEVVQRFFNEARAAAAIHHPGIVEIYDFGYRDNGSAYIAMEYLTGEGLDARLKRLGRLPVQQALRFVGQLASALGAAHESGIYHRDLKPPNVFIVPDKQVAGGERVKVLDFGIAKMLHNDDPGAKQTQAGALMGSPKYMSPEQCQGAGEIDHRADLYSVGCILFEMLCGQAPFDGGGQGTIAILAAQLSEQAVAPSTHRPELTAEIDSLVLHLLAKDPDHRPQSAADLAAWVSSISGEQVSFASASRVIGSTETGAHSATGSSEVTAVLPDSSTRPTGTGATGATGTTGSGRTGNERLIDQLARPVTRQGTGADTSPMAAPAHNTARSRISQLGAEHADDGAHERSGRRLAAFAVPTLVALAALVVWWSMSDAPTQKVAQQTAEAPEPTAPETAEPPPPPEPKLSFYSLEERQARRARREQLAQLQQETGVAIPANMVSWQLPSFSLSSLLSGNFLDSLAESFTTILEPAPTVIKWTIATSPPGAEVMRDGEVVGTTESPFTIELDETPEFTGIFTLRLDRYQDRTLELKGDENFNEVIELEPRVYAMLESKPAGAEVFDASGAALGVTPVEIELAASLESKQLTLKLDRHEDAIVELAGTEDYTETVELVPTVYATVLSRPDGAQVYDQQEQLLGTVPLELPLTRSADGGVEPRTVTVRLDDKHEDAQVELSGRKSFKERVKLTPKIFATVESRPAGAEVFAPDGTSLGTAPVSFEVPRAEQPAKVTLSLDGHRSQEVALRGRRSFTKKVKLRPLPSITVTTTPAGAEVFAADGSSLGAAPVSVLAPVSGEPMRFVVKQDGYRTEEVEVATKRDKKVKVKLARALGPVTVRIESTPAGAEVWKDGKLLGQAPLDDRFEGFEGRVKYVLKQDGFADKTVRVSGSSDTTETVKMRKCQPKRGGALAIVTVYGGC